MPSHFQPAVPNRLGLVLVLLLASVCLGGCVARTTADPDRGLSSLTLQPLDDVAWPDRMLAMTDGRLVNPLTRELKPGTVTFNGGDVPVPCVGQLGKGYVFTPDLPEDASDTKVLLFESTRMESLTFHGVGGSSVSGSLTRRALTEYYLVPELTESRRGLIVHLSSLSKYNDNELSVVNHLRRQGWAVLATSYPIAGFSVGSIDNLSMDDGAEDCARCIASHIDNRIAEWAYGIEAILMHLGATDPSLAELPTVIMGYSAGALALPAVVARDPDQFDAAVLVGGGANLLEILHTSSLPQTFLRDSGLAMGWRDRAPDGDSYRTLISHYLRLSALDPFHMAPYLGGIPVLLLTADWDRIVHARAGDVLHKRLGFPERWNFAMTGHLGLFMMLPHQTGSISRWIDTSLDE